jgi:thiamine biosynthesis lipoprotein
MPSAKSNQKPQPNWQFEAIGTQWSIETERPLDSVTKEKISRKIEAFDRAYSRFRDDSLVMKIAEKPGEYIFPDDSSELVKLYRALYDATDGAVSPLVGDTLSSLGYDKDYSLHGGAPKPVPEWDDVMQWDGPRVVTSQPVIIDFGAVGKGYLVDKVADVLESEGIADYVIDASGDIRTRGQKQVVGLENPFDTTMVIGAVELQHASLCGSATNRRSWGNGLHHVIDGRTGEPTQTIVATWVVADSTALADGLATALFFADAAQLQTVGDFEFVRLYHDGHIEHSAGFVGELFV